MARPAPEIEEGALFRNDKIVCNPLSCGKPSG